MPCQGGCNGAEKSGYMEQEACDADEQQRFGGGRRYREMWVARVVGRVR